MESDIKSKEGTEMTSYNKLKQSVNDCAKQLTITRNNLFQIMVDNSEKGPTEDTSVFTKKTFEYMIKNNQDEISSYMSVLLSIHSFLNELMEDAVIDNILNGFSQIKRYAQNQQIDLHYSHSMGLLEKIKKANKEIYGKRH